MRADSPSFSTAISGDGMSGLPNPRSMTSTPARRASIFRLLMIVNTYGGKLVMRRKSIAAITLVPPLPRLAATYEMIGVAARCHLGVCHDARHVEPAPRGLHPRGHRDPPRQPQQVRDRPPNRPRLPRSTPVHGD